MSNPEEKRPGRRVELWALLTWVRDSWLRPAGSRAAWEQKAGKLELAWTEAPREAQQSRGHSGSSVNAASQQETQSTGGAS